MTDVALAASPLATPLTGGLASTQSSPEKAVYHGVLTPVGFDARIAETESLLCAAAVHDLGWLRRILVRGEDRERWISGMTTNMVKDLPANAGAWNLVLNAQGRIQGDLTVWRKGDDLELEIAADQLERLLAHLEHFIIMDDVELAVQEGETALGLTGPKSAEVLARIGLPVLPEPMTQTAVEWNGMSLHVRRGYGQLADHYELWTTSATVGKLWNYVRAGGAQPVGSAALEAFRIAEGIPAYGLDIVEKDLPQETSQMRALCFNKGCYLGQEIVERIRSRGSVHRHLRHLELDGPLPVPGTELQLDGASVGHVTSSAELPLAEGVRRFALGTIRAEAETSKQDLTYASGEAAGVARLLNAPPVFSHRNG